MKQYEKEDLCCCANCIHANSTCSACLKLKKEIDASGVCDEWEYDMIDKYERETILCELNEY